MMRKKRYIFLLFPFFAALPASAQNNSSAKKSMFVKADTTLVIKQELTVSKLETKKEKSTKKREKWLGPLIELLRDVIKDNQVY